MIAYIIGAFLILIGSICFYFTLQNKKKIETINLFPKMSIQQILGGAFQSAKARGKIVSDEPLVSELTKSQCVYYKSEVYRKYRRRRTSNSSKSPQNQYHEELISSNERKQDFYIDDGTGNMKVCLEGADFEKEQVLNDYKPSDGSEGMKISFGNFNFNLGNLLNNERTLGYRYKEWIIPINKEILVIGGVKKEQEPYFTVHDDSTYKYLISFKQESELIFKINKDNFYTKIAMFLCFLSGFGALIYQFMQNLK